MFKQRLSFNKLSILMKMEYGGWRGFKKCYGIQSLVSPFDPSPDFVCPCDGYMISNNLIYRFSVLFLVVKMLQEGSLKPSPFLMPHLQQEKLSVFKK